MGGVAAGAVCTVVIAKARVKELKRFMVKISPRSKELFLSPFYQAQMGLLNAYPTYCCFIAGFRGG